MVITGFPMATPVNASAPPLVFRSNGSSDMDGIVAQGPAGRKTYDRMVATDLSAM